MTQSITIPKEVPPNSALSYDFLRQEGMELIQKMAAATWTDHNIHDPGITMLEQVCYAITDLAYRMDYDIQDLLGSDDQSSYKDLYSAATILTVNPVTLLDLRKIILDVEGVKNAWVEKVQHADRINDINGNEQKAMVPKGLYQVFLEQDGLFEISGSKIVSAVREKLMECRGICEDFESITLLTEQKIRLQGVIEIADTVEDVNQMVAQMLLRVEAHLSPRVPFYTLQQQLEKGKRTDEVFDGPRLNRGFIEDEELLRNYRKTDVQTSDIIREIMDEEGVLAIDTLELATGVNTVKKWLLPLDLTQTPTLDLEATLNQLSFTSKGLKVGIDTERVSSLYTLIRGEGLTRITSPKELDLFQPETSELKLANYQSIQNQFPTNFGIGEIGLPDSASETRKAQAKQLSAYLLFFEQTLANYFSQVANFKQLMSFDGDDTKTYFNQSLLTCVPGASEVVGSEENYANYLTEMTADSQEGLLRKNKFLNHLLARFAEKFTGYGMVLQDVSNDTVAADKKLIKDKARFLQQYPVVSSSRGKAYNYNDDYWDTENVSGLEKRIALKLGIDNYTRRNLGDADIAGFHMVEHLLLRKGSKYPYPFSVQYDPINVFLFLEGSTPERTKCMVGVHSLKVGEEIRISNNAEFDGVHRVVNSGDDFIEIDAPFEEPASTAGVLNRAFDIRYFLRAEGIESFSEVPSDSNHALCTVTDHTLKIGDSIEITRTNDYNGVHEIVAVTEGGFEIAVPFTENETVGKWMPTVAPKDPYSLQLTFALPNWIEKHQNADFRKFVTQTIREETPVHVRVSLKWLDRNEMQEFDRAFHAFLDHTSTK